MNFAFFKKHPLAAGAVVIVGGIIVFMIFRSNSGGNSADGSVADSSGYSSDPRIAAIQAGADVQAGQQQAQLQMAQLQAGVINEQTDAALQVAKLQAERDQNIAQITADAEVAKAQIAGDTQVETVHTQAAAYEAALTESTKQEQIAADASIAINDSRNDVIMQQLQLDSEVIAKAGQDKGRSSTGWAQIISALEGQGPAAIAANQPSAVASSPEGILSGIGSIAKGIFAAL